MKTRFKIESWGGFNDDEEEEYYLRNYDKIPDGEDDEIYDEDHPNYDRIPSEEDLEDYNTDDNSKDDDMESLCYLLRKFFSMSNIEAEVTYVKGAIEIYCFLEKKEKMGTIMRCFDVVEKLERDTLQGYSCSFEMWENREGYPVLNFQFTFGEKKTELSDDDWGHMAPF